MPIVSSTDDFPALAEAGRQASVRRHAWMLHVFASYVIRRGAGRVRETAKTACHVGEGTVPAQRFGEYRSIDQSLNERWLTPAL